MRLEAQKYLYDKQAADLLVDFTAGTHTDYEENSMLRAAVYRKFDLPIRSTQEYGCCGRG